MANLDGRTKSVIINIDCVVSSVNRLSSAYLENERIKLAKQRNLLRIVQNETKTHYQSEKVFQNNLPSLIIPPLQPGARVIGEYVSCFLSLSIHLIELVRLFRSRQFGLYRGQFLSRNEANSQQYQILFDDSSIGLLNVNDYDVMVNRKP